MAWHNRFKSCNQFNSRLFSIYLFWDYEHWFRFSKMLHIINIDLLLQPELLIHCELEEKGRRQSQKWLVGGLPPSSPDGLCSYCSVWNLELWTLLYTLHCVWNLRARQPSLYHRSSVLNGWMKYIQIAKDEGSGNLVWQTRVSRDLLILLI